MKQISGNRVVKCLSEASLIPRHPRDLGAPNLGKRHRACLLLGLKNRTVEGFTAEFGVFKGRSLRFIAVRTAKDTVYGFDSFKGLPEDWLPGIGKGRFAVSKDEQKELVWPENVKLYPGWFEDTLLLFKFDEIRPAALLHVDCDLYSSAKTVLTALKTRIVRGTVLVFDEYVGYAGWEKGEALAFEEFLFESGRHAKFLGYQARQAVAIMED